MSKGTVSGGGDGLYSATILKDDGSPETKQAWCADLTEDLSGTVGIIEIAGDIKKGVNVQPGFGGNAAYNAARDGNFHDVPASGGSQPATGVYWNWAMRSGWQKWRSEYRYGTIRTIDYGADTCTVTLEACLGTDTGLDVNQATGASCTISYMNCNAAAFEVGDNVVVKFSHDAQNNWVNPVVIGFKSEPKGCFNYVLVTGWHLTENDYWVTLLDVRTQAVAEIEIDDIPIVFPCALSDIQDWLDEREDLVFEELYTQASLSASWGTPSTITDPTDIQGSMSECTPGFPLPEEGTTIYTNHYVSTASAPSGLEGLNNTYYRERTAAATTIKTCTTTYRQNDLDDEEISLRYFGKKYVAQNGSEAELFFYYAYNYSMVYSTIWRSEGGCSGTIIQTYNTVGSSGLLDVEDGTLVKEATDYDPNCVSTLYTQSQSGNIQPDTSNWGSGFNENMNAIVQIFSLQYDDGTFPSYVFAGYVGDYQDDPTSLPNAEDLSDAVEALFVECGSHWLDDLRYF